MRRPAIRRFPNEVIRRRVGPESYNEFGEHVPGAVVTAILPGAIEPVSLEDNELVGGQQLSERIRVFVPTGVERVVGTGDVLTWAGDDLRWNGEPLTWGGISGLVPGDREPLVAAFEDRTGDEVEYASTFYVVEETQTWPGLYCRAILLRQS